MYGEKSDKIEIRLNELENQGKQDTAEYKHLVEKWNKTRKKELEKFNKNWRENNRKRGNFL